MSTQQGSYNTYIGARYVPIFDGQWSNTKAYEPLVIVEYQGNSYTSKTYVPIGADINNTDYWALTGNYNAQVEAYRQEVLSYQETVETFDDRITENANTLSKMGSITKLQDKKFLFLGDSVMVGAQNGSTEPSSYNYPKVFSELTGATVDNKAFGGACAVPDPNIGEPNNYNLVKMVTDTDLTSYDGIFIGYGINDWAHQHKLGNMNSVDTVYNTFYGAWKTALNTIFTKKKTIEVYIINFPWFTGYDFYENNKYQAYTYNRALKNIANFYSIPFVDFESVLDINELNYTGKYWDSWVHPNDSTLQYMGWYIARNYPFNYATGDKNIELNFPTSSPFNMFGYYDWANYNLKNTFSDSSLENGITMKYAGSESEGSAESFTKRAYYLKEGSYYTFCCSLHTDAPHETYVLMQVSKDETLEAENQYDFYTGTKDDFYYFTFKAKTTGMKKFYIGTTSNNGYPLYVSSMGLYAGKIPYLYAPPQQNNVREYTPLPLADNVTVAVGAGGSSSICYYVDNEGYVNFQGAVEISADSTNGYITILPNYIQPVNDMLLNVTNWNDNKPLTIYVKSTDGAMYINAWDTSLVPKAKINFSLENIRFKVKQNNAISIAQ